jgi:hypothetical protein
MRREKSETEKALVSLEKGFPLEACISYQNK